MPQAVSLGTGIVREVLYCATTVIYTTTVNCASIYIQTSIRLTVTVYSPSRELTVDRCLPKIGWKLVEISFVEFAHDREGKSIFISVVEAFPPIVRPCFLGTLTWVHSPGCLGTVANKKDIRVLG